jgi:hypothetical protein
MTVGGEEEWSLGRSVQEPRSHKPSLTIWPEVEASVTIWPEVEASLTIWPEVEASLTIWPEVEASLTIWPEVEASLTIWSEVEASSSLLHRGGSIPDRLRRARLIHRKGRSSRERSNPEVPYRERFEE